jgi:hypothetical protein
MKMKENVREEKKSPRFKHITPLNLSIDSTKSPKKVSPLSACDCDCHCNVDICLAAADHTEVCGAYD